jgi:hypothetical protein
VSNGSAQVARRSSSSELHAGRVDNVTRFEFAAAGDGSVAHWNTSDVIAFALNVFAAFAPDRSSHACAQLQIIIRGVDDRVRVHVSQIALLDHNFFCQRTFHSLALNYHLLLIWFREKRDEPI